MGPVSAAWRSWPVRAWRGFILCLAAAVPIGLAGCGANDDGGSDNADLSGGATTVFEASSSAFKLPAPNLTAGSLERHRAGDVAFDRTFVTAPSTPFGGLGPLFNDSSCSGCHVRNGRGPDGLLLRLSVPGAANGEPASAPGFGLQLQTRAVLGLRPEAGIGVSEERQVGAYGDGTPFELRRLQFDLLDPWTSIPSGLQVSPRVPPAVFGLGLLEAVPVSEILARADPDDRDGDGISGRPNRVPRSDAGGRWLGRFGWKAGQPDLRHQSAAAYNGDMGLTTSLFPRENSADQPGTDDGLDDDPELDDDVLEVTTFYVATLGVPARRDLSDFVVRQGEQNFTRFGCAGCHVPTLVTGLAAATPELAGQAIHPYTDLLLHDMGADLADDRPEHLASGREWRTPPLWGIGLLETVNGVVGLLHDGRARSIEEAILWHGGEARAAQESFRQAPREERESLIRFLRSL